MTFYLSTLKKNSQHFEVLTYDSSFNLLSNNVGNFDFDEIEFVTGQLR